MPDDMAIIKRIFAEHAPIKNHLKLVGDTLNDFEAYYRLESASVALSQSSISGLSRKLEQLKQAIQSLEEGLTNHFHFEDTNLPPLLGSLLMRALELEHQQIRYALSDAKTHITNISFAELSQRDTLTEKASIVQKLVQITKQIVEHARHEEVMLRMIQTVLSAEAGSP